MGGMERIRAWIFFADVINQAGDGAHIAIDIWQYFSHRFYNGKRSEHTYVFETESVYICTSPGNFALFECLSSIEVLLDFDKCDPST